MAQGSGPSTIQGEGEARRPSASAARGDQVFRRELVHGDEPAAAAAERNSSKEKQPHQSPDTIAAAPKRAAVFVSIYGKDLMSTDACPLRGENGIGAHFLIWVIRRVGGELAARRNPARTAWQRGIEARSAPCAPAAGHLAPIIL